MFMFGKKNTAPIKRKRAFTDNELDMLIEKAMKYEEYERAQMNIPTDTQSGYYAHNTGNYSYPSGTYHNELYAQPPVPQNNQNRPQPPASLPPLPEPNQNMTIVKKWFLSIGVFFAILIAGSIFVYAAEQGGNAGGSFFDIFDAQGIGELFQQWFTGIVYTVSDSALILQIIMAVLGISIAFAGRKIYYYALAVPAVYFSILLVQSHFTAALGVWTIPVGAAAGIAAALLCIFIHNVIVIALGAFFGYLALFHFTTIDNAAVLIFSSIAIGVILAWAYQQALVVYTAIMGSYLFILAVRVPVIWLGLPIAALGVFIQYKFFKDKESDTAMKPEKKQESNNNAVFSMPPPPPPPTHRQFV